MQSMLCNAKSRSELFYLCLNVDGMNEIDQLGVCCRQPCIDSLGVGAAEHLRSVVMGFRTSAMPSRIADDLSKQGLHVCYIRRRTRILDLQTCFSCMLMGPAM